MNNYRADIDGLRAVAVLSVVLYHAGGNFLGGGFVGVDVFFVISGYVITRRLLEDAALDQYSIKDFYLRRVRRIFPALFATILCTWVVGLFILLPPAFEDLSKSMAATAVSASNIYFWLNSGYFDPSAILQPLLHTWSLAVEEQYYIFMPLAIYLVGRFGGQRWGTFFIPVAVLSLALSVYATRVAPTANFFLLPTRAWELLLGALLVLTPLPSQSSRLVSEILGIIGSAMIAYAIFFFTESTPFPGLSALLPCVGSAILIYAGGGHHQPLVTRLISLRPFVWVGLISYSLYLTHWPVVAYSHYVLLHDFTPTNTLAIVAASIALGAISYRFVERPFRYQNSGKRAAPAFISAGLIIATFAGIGYAGVLTSGLPQRFPDFRMRDIAGRDVWMTRTCFLTADQSWHDWDSEKCTRTSGQNGTVLLWGDSFAAHYVAGLIGNNQASPVKLIQYTAAGCPPILSYFSYSLPHCHDFNQHVLDVIREMKIDRVVISARWLLLRTKRLEEFSDTIEQLNKSGVSVYVIGQSPEFPIDVQTLAYRERHADAGGAGGQWPVAIDMKINVELRSLLNGRVTFIDPLSVLCNGSMCPFLKGNDFLYEDFGHLSALGSEVAIKRYFPPRTESNAAGAFRMGEH